MNKLNKFLINKNIKMLVFDMAGTVVNESGIVYETLYQTMKSNNLNVTRDDMDKWHGFNKYEVLGKQLSIDMGDAQNYQELQSKLFNDFDNNLHHNYFNTNSLKLIDNNIPELFNRLRTKGIKMCLDTGYGQEMQESIIKHLNMMDFIDDYISSSQVKYGRPYPYMIYALMERHDIITPKQVIKFGDTPNDILEGLNANCYQSVGVLSGADGEQKLTDSGATNIINNVMALDVED
eukprot:381050_1